MSVNISQARGDLNLLDINELKDGQLFWARKNDESFNSNNHSYNPGTLYIKQNNELVAITSTRGASALSFRGFIDNSFNGNFIEAPLDSVYNQVQVGDLFIFSSDNNNLEEPFRKSDLLIITKAEYSNESDNEYYSNKLSDVEYIRCSSRDFDNTDTGLLSDDLIDAVRELNASSLKYKGVISSENDLLNIDKQIGGLYLLDCPLVLAISQVLVDEKALDRFLPNNLIQCQPKDFIFWNGTNWTLIPSGVSDISYRPNESEINAIFNICEFHRDLLKSATTIGEALDILNVSKAPLDSNNKVPIDFLPNSITSGLTYKGKFYPVMFDMDNPNDIENQNDYPLPIDANNVQLESYRPGWFYIIDCLNFKNVQYIEKSTNRVLELNTGDWIVWTDLQSGPRFEIIDNSDRISSIDVTNENNETVSILGNVGIKSLSEDLKVNVTDNTILLDLSGSSIFKAEDGVIGKLPKFDSDNSLINSNISEYGGDLFIEDNVEIGKPNNTKDLDVNGSFNLHWTINESTSELKNPIIIISSQLEDGSERTTTIETSELEGLENVRLILPNTNARLITQNPSEVFSNNYITKANDASSLTTSLIKENNNVVNIGVGELVSERLKTSSVSFYADSEDIVPDGFYKELVENFNGLSSIIETRLNSSGGQTHLSINPFVLLQGSSLYITLPRESGTLITFHEIERLLGSQVSEDLMIPVWRTDYPSNGELVTSLGKSPIRTRINTQDSNIYHSDRQSDLAGDYGEGRLKTTWTYKESDKTGSTQEVRTDNNKNDLLTIDAWLDVQRSIATKEAFILPSTNRRDTQRFVDRKDYRPFDLDDQMSGDLLDYSDSGRAFYSRIVPSKTVFENDAAYFDMLGNEIPQEVAKTFELPESSGVLTTHNSILQSKFYD